MSQLTLPPVAKSFYMFCKKCDGDRYHTVLAHTNSTTAKMQCEICKSKKNYSLPKKTSTRKPGSTNSTKTSRAKSHTGEYENRTQNQSSKEAIPYSTKTVFIEKQKIQHPKFGIGFVQKAAIDRIDVIFSDEVKVLIHNKI
jgi:hypothetical protein